MTLAAAGTLRLYGHLVRARVRSQTEYRASFALDVIGSTLIASADFVVILILFDRLPALGGFTLEEVALIYGLSGVAFGLADLCVGHLDKLRDLIRDGTFDALLVRPVGSLFQAVSSDFALRKLGKVAQAAAVLAVALVANDLTWTIDRVLVIAVAIAAGAVIFASVWVIGCSITFWTVESTEVANAFTYGGNQLTSYPINIFGPVLRRLLAFVVPLAFVGYFPALYVLDKPDPLGLPRALQLASPLVAVASAAVASWVWRLAVRHYRSTGS
ncbi:ABC transporter permease [soil metagenome]